MPRKSETGNVKKRCACSRQWACSHPWYIDYKAPATHATRAGERYRVNLDDLIDRHCVDLNDAKTEAGARSWRGRTDATRASCCRATIRRWRRSSSSTAAADASAAGKRQRGHHPDGRERPAVRRVARWRHHARSARGVPPAAAAVAGNRDLALLRAMFNWAVLQGSSPTTPFKVGTVSAVKLAREEARTRRLQPGEEERLLLAANGLARSHRRGARDRLPARRAARRCSGTRCAAICSCRRGRRRRRSRGGCRSPACSGRSWTARRLRSGGRALTAGRVRLRRRGGAAPAGRSRPPGG